MFQNFWEGVTGGIAGGVTEAWANRILGPALFFWGGGAFIWATTYAQTYGWNELFKLLTSMDTTQSVMLLFAFFLLLNLSDLVIEWLTLPILRFLEGYWPTWIARHFIGWKRSKLRTLRQKRRTLRLRQRWHLLDQKRRTGTLSAAEQQLYDRLGNQQLTDEDKRNPVTSEEINKVELQDARYPVDERNLLPTPLGNILRTAEEYPYVKYGLETTTVWPRLWLLLPTETQQEISIARQQLDLAARFLAWGILFNLWRFATWWPVPVAIAIMVMLLAYNRMLHTARVYGDLLRATFDLHRFKLYHALHWQLPADSQAELESGQALTQYISQRQAQNVTIFHHASTPELE